MTIIAVNFSGGAGKAIGSLVATTESRVFTLTSDHKDFDDILSLIKAGNLSEAELRLDRATHVRAAVVDTAFDINGSVVTYNGRQLPAIMADYIIRLNTEGFDLAPLEKFTENLFANPSYRATQECFKFIEANEMPITEDGCFIAYRSVTLDYKDHRTGTFDNSIGAVCTEDRNLVDEDPNNTCAAGLHVCALGYINGPDSHGYGGSRSHWVIVKVNPKNVVAVPHDYKNTKMRVCEFEVIGQLDKSKIDQDARKSYVEDRVLYKAPEAAPAAPAAPAAKVEDPKSDKALIAAGLFVELGRKHFGRNQTRGGDPLTRDSFDSDETFNAYISGYNNTAAPTVKLSNRDEARKLYNAKDAAGLIELKRQKRVGFDRLGITPEEAVNVHRWLATPATPATATPPATQVAATVTSSQSEAYNRGFEDGRVATSFLPRDIGNEYWSGFSAAWAKNPNNPSS